MRSLPSFQCSFAFAKVVRALAVIGGFAAPLSACASADDDDPELPSALSTERSGLARDIAETPEFYLGPERYPKSAGANYKGGSATELCGSERAACSARCSSIRGSDADRVAQARALCYQACEEADQQCRLRP